MACICHAMLNYVHVGMFVWNETIFVVILVRELCQPVMSLLSNVNFATQLATSNHLYIFLMYALILSSGYSYIWLHSLHVNIAESIVRGHLPSCVHSRLMVNEQTKKHQKSTLLIWMMNLITNFLQSCLYFNHIPGIHSERRSKFVHARIFPGIWETVLFWYS